MDNLLSCQKKFILNKRVEGSLNNFINYNCPNGICGLRIYNSGKLCHEEYNNLLRAISRCSEKCDYFSENKC